MKRKTVKKIVTVMLTATMVVGMLAGCGGKDPETTVNTEVSTQKEVTSNEVATEKSVTMIQNTANELSAVIGEIQTAKNHSFEKLVFTYQNESVTITEKSISDHKTNKKLTVTKTEKKKEFFNAQGVPQVSLTFKEVTKSAQPLKIEITWKDKEGAETSKSATVNIHVVPESLKVVKPLTENQKISETVKKYDFDVFAKNVADKAKESVVSATVKKSDVQFGKPGHYEVVYEVVLKTDNNNVPVDVEIVEKEQADKSEDVITENVKPGESKEDVPVDVEIVDKDNDNGAITENVKPGDDPTVKPEKKQETGGNTSSDKNNDSSDKNNQSDKNNNSSSNKPNSGNSSSNKPNGGNSGSNGNSSGSGQSGSGNNGNGNTGGNNSHKHHYTSAKTANESCTANGTITYTCSCGDSYTESIPAYGHAWTHHDATGHWGKEEVTPGWDEPIYETRVVCGGCGAQFTSTQAAGEHIAMDFWDNCENYHTEDVQTGTIHHDAVYKDVWVEDSKAYDSCTNCGATK